VGPKIYNTYYSLYYKVFVNRLLKDEPQEDAYWMLLKARKPKERERGNLHFLTSGIY
jgi:hypothetical protein